MSSFHPMPSPPIFTRKASKSSQFHLYPLIISHHIDLIHRWVTQDYAHYWGMQTASSEHIGAVYRKVECSQHEQAYLGFHNNVPAFLLECYSPEHAEIGLHYEVQKGDRGMHILVAPPTQLIPGFTLQVMQTIMTFMFNDPDCKRIVVEPDIRNKKIHVLNARVGFINEKPMQLANKLAQLAFCRREQFLISTLHPTPTTPETQFTTIPD